MDPRLFVRLLVADDHVAAARRDEEFRAWHRRPDATPLAADPPAARRERLTIVRRLASALALLGLFGRHG